MAKYKKDYEKWGGRELKAIINGKLTGVKHDKGANTFFVRIPQPTGRAIKQNLGRDKGKAAGKWWAIVGEHQKEQMQTLPTDKLKTRKVFMISQQPNQTVEYFDKKVKQFASMAIKQQDETQQEWNDRVFNNPNMEPFINTIETLVPEQVLADIFNKWLEDPYECSRRLGREDIANLHKLQVRDPISLYKMGQFYYDYIPTNREQASQKERRYIRSWFEQFIRIVNKTYLDELTKADIQHYTQTILQLAKKDKRSTTWISHRYHGVRNVVNTFSRSLEDKTVPNRVLSWLKDFPAPMKGANGKRFNPKHLSKEQVQELLSVVKDNKKWRAIVLFALNTCSYAVDCRDVKLEWLDLDNKHLTMMRKKKAVPKCGVLWDETVESIRDYLDNRKSNSPYLFISLLRDMMSESAVTRYVRENIKSKLSWNFDFNMLRDSGRYAAELGKATSNHIKIAMGHRISGEDDAYLFRHPELVQDVSDAIYKYYML